MRKQRTEKQFKALGNLQSSLLFPQIQNEPKPISSASKISLNRTYTPSQILSQLQMTPIGQFRTSDSNNRLITNNQFENIQLNYPTTTSFTLPIDLALEMKKILHLLESKKNIISHISQSLGLICPNKLEFGKDVGQVIGDSFGEYIILAQKINTKLIKEESAILNKNTQGLNRQMAYAKKQNACLLEQCHKLEEDSLKYRRFYELHNSTKSNNQQNTIQKIMLAQFGKIFEKMTTFKTQLSHKLDCLQEKLRNIATERNSIANNRSWREQTHKYQSINNQLHKLLQQKIEALERITAKEDNYLQSSQIELRKYKQLVEQKNKKIMHLQHQLQKAAAQLNSHKNLYDQMLDKNIELQKEITLFSQKGKRENHSPSLDIVEYVQGETSYFRDKIIEDWAGE